MSLNLDDTIVALATAQGPGARAVVRLSGPDSFGIVQNIWVQAPSSPPNSGHLFSGELRLPGLHAALPTDLYFWRKPRSYSGQDLTELHTWSAPPLVEHLVAQCLTLGARAAQPGEFTLRAFLAGKLDLTGAEAVLGVIEAGNRHELTFALAQLAGGLARPLKLLREDLLNLLADLEAGLDFADEDLSFVNEDDFLRRLAHALAILVTLQKQLEGRALGMKRFRAVLAGPPNAGKSRLFNALIDKDAALVSPIPGTTRDYLEQVLDLGDMAVCLVDTAGLGLAEADLDLAAQQKSQDQFEHADLVLWCQEKGDGPVPEVPSERFLPLATKCDQEQRPTGWLATSAATGFGLDQLRDEMVRRGQARRSRSLAPSLSRCRHHVATGLTCLRRAHALVLAGHPPELLALDLREALDHIGAMVGAVHTDDLLNRIFSRFCIGK